MTDSTLTFALAALTIWFVIDRIWVRAASDQLTQLSRRAEVLSAQIRGVSAQINELKRRLAEKDTKP